MDKSQELNPKQKRFVAEYLLGGNATQAAIAAGYSPKTAGSQGDRLLRHAVIQAGLAAARAKLEIKTEITQERVLAELKLLAFSNIQHYATDAKGNVTATESAPKGAMGAVASVKRKFFKGELTELEIKLWDKPSTLKLAGRHVGLFPDRVEIAQADDKPLAIIVSGSMPVPPELAEAVGAAVVGAAVASRTTTMDDETKGT